MKLSDKNLLLGKFDPATHENFVKVSAPYTTKNGIFLQKETYEAFILMHEAAKNDGITLTIISGTRNFTRQKEIWEKKWNGQTPVNGKNLKLTVPDPIERAQQILKYSSMPGTSRHHWGTDIDINSVNPAYFTTRKGLKELQWLENNARNFGFCRPYKMKNLERFTGYEDEPWHWSYIPLSSLLLEQYLQYINYDDLQGFDGCETAKNLDVIKNYVLGIHSDCLRK